MPSAKLIATDLQADFGRIPAAMIPLGGHAAIENIVAPHYREGFDVLIAVHEESGQVEELLARNRWENARAVDVGPTNSLGSTILHALDTVENDPEILVIQFADTIVQDPLPGGDVICYAVTEDTGEWTSFSFDQDRRIVDIIEKDAPRPDIAERPVFIGRFALSQPAAFRRTLRAHVESPVLAPVDSFYRALMDYFNALPDAGRRLQEVTGWWDLGHLETYYRTKRRYFINRRFFNDIDVAEHRGVVRKSSTDREKLKREYTWYEKQPSALKVFTPRVLEADFDADPPYMEIEFYGYPALDEVYLFGRLGRENWHRIFQAIDAVLSEMARHPLPAAQAGEQERARYQMYVEKSVERLSAIIADDRFLAFAGGRVTINGRGHYGLAAIVEFMATVTLEDLLELSPRFTIIHGDLCLSNILYDRRTRIIRLIDPRGRFGRFDIHGDPRYDLAKLSHSIEGDYDFFVNDRYDLEVRGKNVVVRPWINKCHQTVKQLFRWWMSSRRGPELADVKAIEALLFLSMVPLHADNLDRQLAMLARGIELFNDHVMAPAGRP